VSVQATKWLRNKNEGATCEKGKKSSIRNLHCQAKKVWKETLDSDTNQKKKKGILQQNPVRASKPKARKRTGGGRNLQRANTNPKFQVY